MMLVILSAGLASFRLPERGGVCDQDALASGPPKSRSGERQTLCT
jgi:hypothetical protein